MEINKKVIQVQDVDLILKPRRYPPNITFSANISYIIQIRSQLNNVTTQILQLQTYSGCLVQLSIDLQFRLVIIQYCLPCTNRYVKYIKCNAKHLIITQLYANISISYLHPVCSFPDTVLVCPASYSIFSWPTVIGDKKTKN